MTYCLRLSKATPRIAAVLTCAATLLATSTSLQAGRITGFTWSSTVASVALDPVAYPVDPNNDDVVGPSPNVVMVHQKDYTGIGPADIEFTVVDSGGVTEYAFIEGVQNGTGFDWTDYHIQLGFGMGILFVPSGPGDGLDFDDGPTHTSPFSFAPFSTVVVAEDGVDAFGGTIVSPSFTSPFVFHVDVPDGITAFTVRQYPTTDFVPEPATMSLALLGYLALIPRHRSRQEVAIGMDGGMC
jgi:hypothetical protein